MIRIVVVDDSVILRDGLKIILEQGNDIEVVGCAGNGKEALEVCNKVSPDLVLMDIRMPVCDGVEGTRLIKEKNSSIKVLILTTFDDDEYIMEALKNGADGYVLKDIGDEDLKRAIKNTVSGLNVIQSNIFKSFKNQCKVLDKGEQTKKVKLDLTEREINIIKSIVDGKSNKEIATSLFITEGTVKNVISAILDKLKLKDRTQLAVFAITNNMV